jgi:cell division protein FtsZ
MGDEVKVTVIAAGFDRWEGGAKPATGREPRPVAAGERVVAPVRDLFGSEEDPLGDDDFDVPSFLK